MPPCRRRCPHRRSVTCFENFGPPVSSAARPQPGGPMTTSTFTDEQIVRHLRDAEPPVPLLPPRKSACRHRRWVPGAAGVRTHLSASSGSSRPSWRIPGPSASARSASSTSSFGSGFPSCTPAAALRQRSSVHRAGALRLARRPASWPPAPRWASPGPSATPSSTARIAAGRDPPTRSGTLCPPTWLRVGGRF